MDKIKNIVYPFIGAIGAALSYVFGGFDVSLIVLFVLMVADYVLGLMCCFTLKSAKTDTGGYNSNYGWKGLLKKFAALIMIIVANFLDMWITHADVFRQFAIITYAVNELMSIIENIGLLGVPLPKFLTTVLDILNKKINSASESGDDT